MFPHQLHLEHFEATTMPWFCLWKQLPGGAQIGSSCRDDLGRTWKNATLNGLEKKVFYQLPTPNS